MQISRNSIRDFVNAYFSSTIFEIDKIFWSEQAYKIQPSE